MAGGIHEPKQEPIKARAEPLPYGRTLNVGADIVRPQARDARPYSVPGHRFRKKAPLLKGALGVLPYIRKASWICRISVIKQAFPLSFRR